MIEVITGPMFAGKTETLIARYKSLSENNQSIIAFRPQIDNRYTNSCEIVSHNGDKISANPILKPQQILDFIKEDTFGVLIDEGQFFDEDLLDIIDVLKEKNIYVLVAGLEYDYKAEPFGIFPKIIAKANKIEVLMANCSECNEPARLSQRLSREKNVIVVGGNNLYEPRCHNCHTVPSLEEELSLQN